MSRSVICVLLVFVAVIGGSLVPAENAVARQFKQLAIAIINYQNSLPPPTDSITDDKSDATLQDSEEYFGDEYLEDIYWELVIEEELELESYEVMWLYDEVIAE